MGNSAFGAGQASVAAHEAAADPHVGYLLEAKAPLGTTFRSGRYYSSPFAASTASLSGTDPTDGLLCAIPFIVGRDTSFDRIGIEHVATTSAGSTMRLGIYSDTNGRPDVLVLDAGTVDLSTAAAFKEITINQALTPGTYWLAAARQGTAGSATVRGYGASVFPLDVLGTDSPGGSAEEVMAAISQASVTGALPNAFTGSTYIDKSGLSTVPVVWVRAA